MQKRAWLPRLTVLLAALASSGGCLGFCFGPPTVQSQCDEQSVLHRGKCVQCPEGGRLETLVREIPGRPFPMKRNTYVCVHPTKSWHGPYVKMGRAGADVEGEYRDDKSEGLFTYYDGDTKVGEGHYRAGKETGPWTHWYPDGKKKNSGAYLDGKKHGLWEQHPETGKAPTYECYVNGTQVWSDPAGKSRPCI